MKLSGRSYSRSINISCTPKCVRTGTIILEIDLAHTSEINLFRESQGALHVEHAVSGNDGRLALRAILEFECGSNRPSGVRNVAHRCESINPDAISLLSRFDPGAHTLGTTNALKRDSTNGPKAIVRVALRDEWCPSRLLRLCGASNTPIRAIRDTGRNFMAMVPFRHNHSSLGPTHLAGTTYRRYLRSESAKP